MTTTKHTTEPWTDTALGHVVDTRGEIICTMRHAYDIDGPANAARITACVNACAGMADPVAEIAALRAAVQAARDQDALADRD